MSRYQREVPVGSASTAWDYDLYSPALVRLLDAGVIGEKPPEH